MEQRQGRALVAALFAVYRVAFREPEVASSPVHADGACAAEDEHIWLGYSGLRLRQPSASIGPPAKDGRACFTRPSIWPGTGRGPPVHHSREFGEIRRAESADCCF